MSDRNGISIFALRRRDPAGRWWCWRFGEQGQESGWYPETPQPDDTPGMIPDGLPWPTLGHCEACIGLRAEHDELQEEVTKLRKEAGELRAQLGPLLWLARTARQLVRGTPNDGGGW